MGMRGCVSIEGDSKKEISGFVAAIYDFSVDMYHFRRKWVNAKRGKIVTRYKQVAIKIESKADITYRSYIIYYILYIIYVIFNCPKIPVNMHLDNET